MTSALVLWCAIWGGIAVFFGWRAYNAYQIIKRSPRTNTRSHE